MTPFGRFTVLVFRERSSIYVPASFRFGSFGFEGGDGGSDLIALVPDHCLDTVSLINYIVNKQLLCYVSEPMMFCALPWLFAV